MNFQPCSEQKVSDRKLLEKGEYRFEILDAWEKTSTAGNPMIELKVRVWDVNGLSRTLTDYLVAKRVEKLRSCCAACGLIDKYDLGCVSDDDFPGKRGRLKVAIEKGKRGYPDRNVIEEYLISQ